MGKKLFLYFVFAIFVLLSVKNSFASFECEVATTCSDPGDVAVFRISSTNNAHAQLPSQTTYQYQVCCGGVATLGNSCAEPNSGVVLRLSAATNAHIQKATVNTYSQPVCLSVSNQNFVKCDYSTSCTNLGKRYTCVASISGDTNANVGNCAWYPTKVCCKVLPNYDFEFNVPAKIVTTVGEQFELKIEISNAGFFPDSYAVSIIGSPANLFEISNPAVTTSEIQSDQGTTISTLVRSLTDTGDYITVTVTSVKSPTLTKSVNIPVKIAKYSLPEFGFSGLMQIIAGATVVYAVLRMSRKW